MKKGLLIFSILFYIQSSVFVQAQVIPDSLNGKYSYKTANIYFEVDKKVGGRITSLKLDNKEIMYVSTASNNNNYGSTLWPSPQSVWNWPPPATLDGNAYAANLNAGSLTLQSVIDSKLNFSFAKNFSVNSVDTSISIVYTIKNNGSTSKNVALWEITRVPSGGYSFFPQGTVAMTGALNTLMSTVNNVVWFDYDSTKIPTGTPKLFSDGSEGWIAHLNNKRQLLVKVFEDIPNSKKAPGEAEIELYANSDKTYVEVEQQGAYGSLAAGSTSNWKVKWLVRNLPADIPLQMGNSEIVSYVRRLIARQVSGVAEPILESNKLNIYPNPTNSNSILSLKDMNNQKVNISVVDMAGKEYYSISEFLVQNNHEEIELKIESLSKGLYIVKVQSNNSSQIKTLIKN